MKRILLMAMVLAGCSTPNTDPAVFVSAQVDDPQISLVPGPLGATLSGSLTLTLHLGARASGSSEVDLRQVDLLDAHQNGSILTLSSVPQSGVTFPVEVDQDSTEAVDLSLSLLNDKGTIDSATQQKLCDPEGVVLKVTVQDSLLDSATPAVSSAFHVAGCP